jgi:hypothetical protein
MFLSRVDTAGKLCYFIYQGGRTMAKLLCPQCGSHDYDSPPNKVVFCGQCGTKLEKAPELPKCKCGNLLFEDQKFCTGCGLLHKEALKEPVVTLDLASLSPDEKWLYGKVTRLLTPPDVSYFRLREKLYDLQGYQNGWLAPFFNSYSHDIFLRFINSPIYRWVQYQLHSLKEAEDKKRTEGNRVKIPVK